MTTTPTTTRRDHPRQAPSWGLWDVVSRWRGSVGALVAQFREGAALLFLDVRVAWRHRGMPRLERRRRLARRELLAVQRAFWDLARVLPVLANPLPPPLGLSLVAVAYRWPRWMLPPQFHSSDQRVLFARRDAAAQAAAALALRSSAPFRDQAHLLRDVLLSGPREEEEEENGGGGGGGGGGIGGVAMTTRLVAHFAEPTGPLSLRAFPRRDLRRFLVLARPRACLDRAPAFFFVPSFVFRLLLRQAAADVDDDDALLLKPGRDHAAIRAAVDALSRTDLLDACVARGLLGATATKTSPQQPGDVEQKMDDLATPEDRLVDWLQRRVALDASWPQKHAPAAFLFCLAVLLHHPESPDGNTQLDSLPIDV